MRATARHRQRRSLSGHELLDEMRRTDPPVMCQFISDNGFNLTVGIDDAFGCMQYSANEGLPPYLMAVSRQQRESEFVEMEFVVGGTQTPIDGQYRLPFGIIRDVVIEFAQSGLRSAIVDWQEF